jgi:AraC-like DNA-binding protein
VVDALRRDAACEAVAHSLRSFSDIAQSLGFAEASTFNRAFRRWTGNTPGAWRAQASASAY